MSKSILKGFAKRISQSRSLTKIYLAKEDKAGRNIDGREDPLLICRGW
jgi:hypothetical protein